MRLRGGKKEERKGKRRVGRNHGKSFGSETIGQKKRSETLTGILDRSEDKNLKQPVKRRKEVEKRGK